MKKLIVLAVILCLIPSVLSVEIKDFVNDYADIISDNEEQQIEQILKQIYDSGAAEFAIVTIDSLEGKDIGSYSLDLAQGNLGDAEKNNGLLLLVAVEDREYRFEVGRGIEYILNDAKAGRIGRNYLVENFRAGDYSKGILEASLAVKSILLEDTESEYYVKEVTNTEKILTLSWIAFIFFIVFFLPILGMIFRNKKSKNRYFNAAMGAVILFGGGRGGSGGLGGGGFGGFGGGGFGGGGASSGW